MYLEFAHNLHLGNAWLNKIIYSLNKVSLATAVYKKSEKALICKTEIAIIWCDNNVVK
ncbi:MAG: hypothetical protein RL207_1315 [Bacteroidota bacterium]|jgi:hypothetical protein